MTTTTAPGLPKIRPTARIPWLLVFALAAGTLAAVVLSGLLLFEIYFSVRILPGVSVWGINLGGQTIDEAAATLNSQLAPKFGAAQLKLVDSASGQTWTPVPAELGIQFDARATAASALQLGRNNADAHFDIIFNGATRSPEVAFNPSVARAYLNQLAAQLNSEPVDAGIQIDGANVIATPAHAGRVLNVDTTLKTLTDMARSFRLSQIDLPFEPRAPRITDASAVAAHLQTVLSGNFTLQLPDAAPGEPSSWDLTPQQMLSLLKIQPSADGTQLQVGFDADPLRSGLTDLDKQVDRDPENARFVFNDDTHQLDVIQHAKVGRQLDVDATMQRMAEAFTRGEHQVQLAVTTTQPDYPDTASAADLGITQLIATGQTYYLGSGQERVNNIDVAAARFHGIIIKPGETFSFDKYLGDVSLDTGFAEALIIANGQTIQGVGGGVCQVSTTALRAAFFAGFPIIHRWPHAYRVGWYERGFGPGLDATVYSPAVAFQFTKDTPYHLLIETYANNALGRLTFKFYSTNDGRQITVGDPVVENVVPHGADIIEEDPTLAPGQRKQVDYAVDGADVTVKRTVTRDGAVISEDTVFTHYYPWQAVYKVGPSPAQ